MTRLVFDDPQSLADFGTFVARAQTVDADGAMRLSAEGTVLASYIGVLDGRGLLGEGAVVGLRTARLAGPASLDITVSLASVADRLARPAEPATSALAVPPTTVSAGWAALTPPRSGWEPVGTVPAQVLRTAAHDGIAQVAEGVRSAGGSAGGHAVAQLRQRVWGQLTSTAPPVPAGAALAAHLLGFLDDGGVCTVFAHGRWTRVSTRTGHVLVR